MACKDLEKNRARRRVANMSPEQCEKERLRGREKHKRLYWKDPERSRAMVLARYYRSKGRETPGEASRKRFGQPLSPLSHEEKRAKMKVYEQRYAAKNPHMAAIKNANRYARLKAAVGQFTKGDLARQIVAQHGCCYYCGLLLDKFHIEHKVPLSRGGSGAPENIVCACANCNLRKWAYTDMEFKAKSGGVWTNGGVI